MQTLFSDTLPKLDAESTPTKPTYVSYVWNGPGFALGVSWLAAICTACGEQFVPVMVTHDGRFTVRDCACQGAHLLYFRSLSEAELRDFRRAWILHVQKPFAELN